MEVKAISIEKCEQSHWADILKIRNLARDFFLNNSLIDSATHEKFMQKHSANYVVAVIDRSQLSAIKDQVVGFCGVVEDDIRVAVHPLYQKLSIGKRLLENINSSFPNATAKIDINNTASVALFESCGFIKKCFLLEKNK